MTLQGWSRLVGMVYLIDSCHEGKMMLKIRGNQYLFKKTRDCPVVAGFSVFKKDKKIFTVTPAGLANFLNREMSASNNEIAQ